jgi:hypothetical protein
VLLQGPFTPIKYLEYLEYSGVVLQGLARVGAAMEYLEYSGVLLQGGMPCALLGVLPGNSKE